MNLKQALARLAATPLFTIFAVLSLAAGVAVTTAVYSVVDTLLLTDLGIVEPERAAIVTTPFAGREQMATVSQPDFEDLQRAQTSFASLSAAAAILPSVAGLSNAETIWAEAVDGSYFSTLGVVITRGRAIQPSDDDAEARVVVISDEFWRGRMAADPGVVGRSIRINAQPFEVIGIAPAGYRGIFGTLRSALLWIPLGSEPVVTTRVGPADIPARDRRRLLVAGRLKQGTDLLTASAELRTIAAALDRDYPPRIVSGRQAESERQWFAKSIAAISMEDNALRRFGMTIVALVALILVVACTNLANLVLARGTARQGELAVRMAMGASRGRLIWEQCLESSLLAIVGMVSAYVMFQALAALMTTEFVMGVPFGGTATLSIRPTLNGAAVTVAIVAMLLALAVFGLEPAVQLARTADIRGALAAGASGVRPRVGRQRMVIRWQVAIAAGFFIVATMFIRSTLSMASHQPGIDMTRLAVGVLSFESGDWDEARIRRTLDRVLAYANEQPAIESLAASTGLPFGVPALQASMARTDTADAKGDAVSLVSGTPSLLRTLGVAIVRGRAFDDRDTAASAPVVIVSELTAKQWFGTVDAIGRSLRMNRAGHASVTVSVVGVARDTDVRFIYRDRRPLVYVPLSQQFDGALTLTARATGDGDRAIPALREAIRRADPDLTINAIGPGDRILAGPFVLIRSFGMGTLYLGTFTLLLSMVGLFGVQSHVVAHRTREIGVRMSVGATARAIKLMVLKDGYRPVIEGLVLGLWGGVAGRIVLRSYLDLENVMIVDPWMLFLTPIPLVGAAFCACYLPASRAASVDPTVALRSQ